MMEQQYLVSFRTPPDAATSRAFKFATDCPTSSWLLPRLFMSRR